MRNPFYSTSQLNLPLTTDICQEIHYTALRAAADGLNLNATPNHLPIAAFRERSRIHGGDAYLVHPDEITRAFRGVTTAVYQVIEELYCNRLERSISMVWKILHRMALEAGVLPIDYEGVWAICQYLQRRRQDNTEVMIERQETTWLVVQLIPEVQVMEEGVLYHPLIVCVLNTKPARVLSFRLGRNEAEIVEMTALAIYDAVVSQRKPSQEGAGGLVWSLPARLWSEINLSLELQNILNQLHIKLIPVTGTIPLLDALRGGWDRDLAGRSFAKHQFLAIFDNYLYRVHRYSPGRVRRKLKRQWASLVGYNRDPAWHFPTLRRLLKGGPGVITPDGTVKYDGLQYEDSLLLYWPNQPVTVRRSAESETAVWVYLGDDILCQATSQKLGRKNGSYHQNRLERG